MKNRVTSLALVIIAANLTFQSINQMDARKSEVDSKTTTPSTAVVKVIGKVNQRYAAMGYGHDLTGFVVQDGEGFRLIRYDHGSMFDAMPAPKMIAITDNHGEKMYMPVTLTQTE